MKLYDKNKNDPLYPWKKHSGFKKGLLTDIVYGDDRKWSGNAQFSTTMHEDYDAKRLALHRDPNALEKFIQKNNSHLDSSVYIPTSAAGRPLGAATNGGNHISFGDASRENKARYESLTANDFKPPPLEREIACK